MVQCIAALRLTNVCSRCYCCCIRWTSLFDTPRIIYHWSRMPVSSNSPSPSLPGENFVYSFIGQASQSIVCAAVLAPHSLAMYRPYSHVRRSIRSVRSVPRFKIYAESRICYFYCFSRGLEMYGFCVGRCRNSRPVVSVFNESTHSPPFARLPVDRLAGALKHPARG